MRDSVPDGWQRVRLGDALDGALGGGTPSRTNPDYWDGPIPWATVKDMHNPTLMATEETITQEGVNASATRVVPAGTVLLATRMAVGAVAWSACDTAINQDLKALIPSPRLDARFLFQFMLRVQPKLQAAGTGTTVKGVSLELVRALDILLPSLPEQRAIAGVLDAVDETIERTEAVIAATEELRKALLHDLLTRGAPGWHTEWKQVPGLGTIPACWEVIRLRDLADQTVPGALQSGPFGSSLLHSEFGNEGKLAIGIDNVLRGRFSLGRQNRISVAKFKELQRYQVRPRDVLITVMASLGRVCVVPDDIEDGIVTKHVYRISVDQSRVDPWFLMWTLLASPGVLTQLYGSAQGQTRLGLNGEILKAVHLAVPRLAEQRAAARVLDAVSRRMALDETQLALLNETKAALAEALLSGRARVGAARSSPFQYPGSESNRAESNDSTAMAEAL